MCLSKLSQLIYGAIVLAAIGLTIGSMFTPGWRTIRAELNSTDPGQIINETISKGIFPFGCAITSDTSGQIHFNSSEAKDACEKWWENQPGYEKAVIALMIVSLIASLLALVWNVLTFFCCIGRGGVFRPLPSLAATSSICLFVAVIVFYVNNDKDIEMIKKWKDVKNVDNLNDVSYSFYLAIAAMLLSFINIIVGSLVVQSAEKCL